MYSRGHPLFVTRFKNFSKFTVLILWITTTRSGASDIPISSQTGGLRKPESGKQLINEFTLPRPPRSSEALRVWPVPALPQPRPLDRLRADWFDLASFSASKFKTTLRPSRRSLASWGYYVRVGDLVLSWWPIGKKTSRPMQVGHARAAPAGDGGLGAVRHRRAVGGRGADQAVIAFLSSHSSAAERETQIGGVLLRRLDGHRGCDMLT